VVDEVDEEVGGMDDTTTAMSSRIRILRSTITTFSCWRTR